MQFMLLLKGDPPVGQPDEKDNFVPPRELIEAMGRFHKELSDAGVLLAAEGLFPTGMGGARVVYRGGAKTVVDGPFAEAKELVAGYYLIDVRSREEAIEWARRCPVEYAVAPGADTEAVVEVRQIAAAVEDTFPELAG